MGRRHKARRRPRHLCAASIAPTPRLCQKMEVSEIRGTLLGSIIPFGGVYWGYLIGVLYDYTGIPVVGALHVLGPLFFVNPQMEHPRSAHATAV